MRNREKQREQKKKLKEESGFNRRDYTNQYWDLTPYNAIQKNSKDIVYK